LSTVVSGDRDAVLAVANRFEARDRKTIGLVVSHAFHSPHMEAMLDDFGRVAASLSFQPPRIPIVSNRTGKPASAEELCSPAYWVGQVRDAVRFADGMDTLFREGVTTFVELGPQAVLCSLAQAIGTEPADCAFLPVLAKHRPSVEPMLTALGALHVRGATVDWSAFFAPLAARHVALPTYPFQHERYWLQAKTDTPSATAIPAISAEESTFWDAVNNSDLDALHNKLQIANEDQRAALAALLPVLSAWHTQRQVRHRLDSWRYRIAWKPLPDFPSRPLAGTWLVVVPAELAEGILFNSLRQAIAANGATVITVRVMTAHGERARLADHLRQALGNGVTLRGVLSLLALDENPLPAYPALIGGFALTSLLVQALGDLAIDAPVWLLTQGAVSTGAGDPLTHPLQALLWGLARAVDLEYPQRWGWRDRPAGYARCQGA
jgi:malonyl CoA-acyl carrier protein transacylase